MALDVYFKDDIAQGIISGLYAMLSANRGKDIEFLSGAICAYQQQSSLYGLKWPAIEKEVSELLGVNSINAFLDGMSSACPVPSG